MRGTRPAENEICDHGVIAARASAELFGRYNDNLFDTNVKACADRCPHTFPREACAGATVR
jgi:hypothetical protein